MAATAERAVAAARDAAAAAAAAALGRWERRSGELEAALGEACADNAELKRLWQVGRPEPCTLSPEP